MARSVLFNILFFVTTTLFVVIGSPFLFLPRSWAMAALKVHARFELFLLRLIIGTKIEVRGAREDSRWSLPRRLEASICLGDLRPHPDLPRSGAADEA